MNAEQKKLKLLLQQNSSPLPDKFQKQVQLQQLSQEVLRMEYLGRQSFPEKLLAQLSYLSPFVWLAQTAILLLVFFCAFQKDPNTMLFCLALLSPALAFLLLYELSKCFYFQMWELEASCRYNLPQLFLLRLCILLGGDFFVLGCSLLAFRLTDGSLWEFCVYALLPYFLDTALCLWLLRHFRHKVTPPLLFTVLVFSAFFFFFVTSQLQVWRNAGVPIDTLSLWAIFLTFLSFLYQIVRTYSQTKKGKETPLWN